MPYLFQIQYLNVDLKLLMARFELNIIVFGKVLIWRCWRILKTCFLSDNKEGQQKYKIKYGSETGLNPRLQLNERCRLQN